jgi:acyl carrier protein
LTDALDLRVICGRSTAEVGVSKVVIAEATRQISKVVASGTDQETDAAALGNVHRQVRRALTEIFAQVARSPHGDFDAHRSFQEQGIDSLMTLEALAAIKARLGISSLSPPQVFAYPSVAQFAEFLVAERSSQVAAWASTLPSEASDTTSRSQESSNPRTTIAEFATSPLHRGNIAIVGYAFRLPGVDVAGDLWDSLNRPESPLGAPSAARFPAIENFWLHPFRNIPLSHRARVVVFWRG